MKYHIEKNTVQETLVIPLFGRLVCSERFPELFSDPEAERICNSLDYDFAEKRKKMESAAGLFGALEVAQRQYDLRCEVERYLKKHPKAAVVNLGCGLDDTFSKVDNGACRGYNIDFPDVIRVRSDLLPAGDRETNLACDLNDPSWMNEIDSSGGAVFFAAGVFYYFRTEDVKKLFCAMAERFPGGVLAFDSCNERGAKLMRKTWLKEAGITDVSAYFSLEDESELKGWSDRFASVTAKSYMRGYRDIYNNVGAFHKLMIRFCDGLVKMKIIKIVFPAGKEERLDRIQAAERVLQGVIVDDRLKQCGRVCREQQMQLRRMDVPDRITKFFQQREIRKELALSVFGQVMQKVLIFCSVGLCQKQMIVLHIWIHYLTHHVNPRIMPLGLPAVLSHVHIAGNMLSQPGVQPLGCRSNQLVEQVLFILTVSVNTRRRQAAAIPDRAHGGLFESECKKLLPCSSHQSDVVYGFIPWHRSIPSILLVTTNYMLTQFAYLVKLSGYAF